MSYRKEWCGQLTEGNVGETVALAGWVHQRRDLGGVIFIALRDRTGIVQVIIRPENQGIFKMAETVRQEYVVQIKGKVGARPEGMINQAMKTGSIEVEATEIQILNAADPLPFLPTDHAATTEEVRLRYRYIDLRRPEMYERFLFRSRMVNAIRHFLNKQDFVEIETPCLTRATPEGARDYLVPSRVHSGAFYALPQSPQLFKQLLMMSGMERYYQIARCFRDEDLRADRQPEFTQLDIETSFLHQDDILSLIESMLVHLFKELLSVDLGVFPKLSYAEAMVRYGSDKPDLRMDFELVDILEIVKNTEFKVFTSVAALPKGRIVALCVPEKKPQSRKEIEMLENFVKAYGAKGLVTIKVNDASAGLSGIQSSISKFLNDEMVRAILTKTSAKSGDVIFIVADEYETASVALGSLRVHLGKQFGLLNEKAWKPLWVVDFPMFEQAEGRWQARHHPFTMPCVETPEDVKKDPASCLAYAYDLVLNGTELGGGSVRITRRDIQQAVFSLLGIDEKEAQKKFGFLLEAMRYGCPPMGGIALGIDRMAMLMTGATSLRDVIAFPKTTTASCPLTDAPSAVSEAQLKELHIKGE